MNQKIKFRMPVFLAVCLSVITAITGSAQDLEIFEEKVTEFTLDSGLHFIIIERHVAPVASFITFVDVGSVNEPVNHTGIAHIFEHMVFKGSNTVGTTHWEAEQEAIDKMDAAYRAWLDEKYKPNPDESKMNSHWEEFEKYQEEANQYVITDEFTQIVEREGAEGLNAFTSADATAYFYSLPQNKAELWFNLEADRFKNPVLREFYEEKDVIMEERRMRTDSSPLGRLLEEFLSVSFSAHPYGNPVIGWPSDIIATTIEDTWQFYETYYVPENYTIAIAGDVDPERMRELAAMYFSDLPVGESPPKVMTKEPEQRGERRFVIEEESQPIFLAGYHTVNQLHPDWPALQLLVSIISQGRTSRLYKRMVEEEELALGVQAFNGYPGSKFPAMFITYAVPNRGISPGELEEVIDEEIQKVKDGDITRQELDRALTNARAGLVRNLNSNQGLALQLAEAQAQQGDWRRVFTYLNDLENVTLDDLRRVADIYLVKKNRTVGMIVNEEMQGMSSIEQNETEGGN
ncbi:MAG: pitrilysin family protein [Balneolaceae bacterium]